ncbi:MAG: FtsB family cell division protein [Christensenellales bacterium]|jgi:cell division protein FtsB
MAAGKNTRKYVWLLVLVVLVAATAIGLSMRSIFGQISTLREELASLEAQLAEEQDKTRKAEERLAYVRTDGYVEKKARERLGWIRDGERRIVFEEAE